MRIIFPYHTTHMYRLVCPSCRNVWRPPSAEQSIVQWYAILVLSLRIAYLG